MPLRRAYSIDVPLTTDRIDAVKSIIRSLPNREGKT